MKLATSDLLRKATHQAIMNGSSEVIELLTNFYGITLSDDDLSNTLVSSCGEGNYLAAKTLLDFGANVNSFGSTEYNPLIISCTYDIDTEMRKKLINLLVQRGANLNIFNEHGRTPLNSAMEYCSGTEIVELLISHGADINFGKNGKTAWHEVFDLPWASIDRKIKLFDIFLQHGADINMERNYLEGKQRPIDIAIENCEVTLVKYLLSHGAIISNSYGWHFSGYKWNCGPNVQEMIEILLHHVPKLKEIIVGIAIRKYWDLEWLLTKYNDLNVNEIVDNTTALYHACQIGKVSRVKMLLEHKASVHIMPYKHGIY